jgi:hypothetical protein
VNVEFLIASDNDLNDIRIATITAKIEDKNLSSHENFRDAVIRAVTAWINGNKDAYTFLEKTTSFDLNIGDLSLAQDDPNLIKELQKEGITNLKITTATGNTNTHWSFDTHLFDPSEIKYV